jgi:hypothetical protein
MERWPRLLTIVLFACALALRAWVPAGWMPAPGAHVLEIMPCPAADPAPMAMHHAPAGHNHSTAGGDCFSPLLAGAALPDAPPAIAGPVPAEPPIQAVLASLDASRFPPALPPPSTGPPQIA